MQFTWWWQFYTVVCRVATILKTRYTAPGFWLAGLRLFELAESLVSEPSQKQHLKVCIAQTKEHLYEVENLNGDSHTNNPTNRGLIFKKLWPPCEASGIFVP